MTGRVEASQVDISKTEIWRPQSSCPEEEEQQQQQQQQQQEEVFSALYVPAYRNSVAAQVKNYEFKWKHELVVLHFVLE